LKWKENKKSVIIIKQDRLPDKVPVISILSLFAGWLCIGSKEEGVNEICNKLGDN
jgi:hypothetical protein